MDHSLKIVIYFCYKFLFYPVFGELCRTHKLHLVEVVLILPNYQHLVDQTHHRDLLKFHPCEMNLVLLVVEYEILYPVLQLTIGEWRNSME